jgi:hypothetical protein
MDEEENRFGAARPAYPGRLPLPGLLIALRDWRDADLECCAFWLLQDPRAWELDGYCAPPRPVGGARWSRQWRDLSDPPAGWPLWPDPQDFRTLKYADPPPSPERVHAFLAQKRAEIMTGALSVPRASLVIADSETDEFLGATSWHWYWDSPENGAANL